MIEKLLKQAAKILQLAGKVDTNSKQLERQQAQLDRLTTALTSTANELRRQRDQYVFEIQALQARIEQSEKLFETRIENGMLRVERDVLQASCKPKSITSTHDDESVRTKLTRIEAEIARLKNEAEVARLSFDADGPIETAMFTPRWSSTR